MGLTYPQPVEKTAIDLHPVINDIARAAEANGLTAKGIVTFIYVPAEEFIALTAKYPLGMENNPTGPSIRFIEGDHTLIIGQDPEE